MINQTHRTLSTVSVITKYIFYYYIQHILLLKIWIHKVFTIYCILFWVFYFGITAATPKQQWSTQWVIFLFVLYLYVLSSFFKGSFHSTILHDERVFQYFFWVFGFSSFLFPVFNNFHLHFHFLYFPFVAQTWFIYGSSRNGTKPIEYCIRNRYSWMHIFPAVIFVKGWGQKVEARHIKAEWEKSIIVNTCGVHSFCPFTLRTLSTSAKI